MPTGPATGTGGIATPVDHLDPPGLIGPGDPALDRESRDRGDGRERLATEAHGRHRLEIGGGFDLAGRVGFDRERKFIDGNARTIVGDPDQVPTAARDLDLDPRRTRVERVLHEFLDHAGGALDHLAGGDLVHDGGWKSANRHPSIVGMRPRRIDPRSIPT